MEKDQLVTLYTTSDSNEAEIICGAINAEGMKCEIGGEHQAGLTGLDTMEIEVLVRAEDFDRAKAFLEEHQRRQ